MSAKNDQATLKTKSKKSQTTNTNSHKVKIQQFEERRRKSALHKYYKELKKSDPSAAKEKLDLTRSGNKQQQRSLNPYEKAKQELEKRKKEKEQLKVQRENEKSERKTALQKYKKEKLKKYVQLKKKTNKGQPVMAGRMELLLEKIQKSMGS